MLDIHFESFPDLATQRLHLREIAASDVDELYELRNHPEVTRYLDRPNDENTLAVEKLIQDMHTAFKQGDCVQWGLALRGSNNLLGIVCFWQIDKKNHRAEIGYMLHPTCWCKGLMTEAILAVLDYGFSTLKLHSVEANTSVANLASQRLLRKCGFVQEAHFRENWFYNGVFSDSLIFCKPSDLKSAVGHS